MMHLRHGVALGVAIVLIAARGAPAAEQTILGSAFIVKDKLPGINPSKRKIIAAAREKEGTNTLVGDPVANGATVEIIANGGSSSSQTFILPAGPLQKPPHAGWRGKVRPGVAATFKYVDKHGTNGPVRILRMSQKSSGRFTIKAVVDGKNGAIDVLPPDPGTDGGMIVTINGGDTYCVGFGGAAGGDVRNKEDEIFKVRRPTGETCPVAQ